MADIFTGGPLNRGTKFLEDVPASLGAVAGAAYDRAFETNPTVMGIESYRRSSDTGEMLDRATVEKMQRENGVTFKIPKNGMPAGAAQMAIDAKYREKLQESVLARSQGGFLNNAAEFGSGLFASIFDPANLAVSVIPFAAGTKWSATLAMQGTTMAQRAGARAGIGATEGALGSLALEPFNYAFARDIQKDYTMMDSLMNVTFGTIIGGGLHVGGGMLSDAFARTGSTSTVPPQSGTIGARVAGMPPEQVHETVALAVAQALNGRKIDVESVMPDVWRSNRPPDAPMNNIPLAPKADIGTFGIADFVTEKGSRYYPQDDGTTIRDKAARPEHPDDFGIQKRSEDTFYVDSDAAIKLGEIQAQNASGKRVISMLDDGQSIGVKYTDGPDAGKFEARTVVPFSRIPEVGKTPVEIWNNGEVTHFGNKIVQVNERASTDQMPAVMRSNRPAPNPTAPSERALTEAEASARPEMQRMYDAEAVKETNDILAAATEIDNALQQEMQEAITKLKASGVDVEKMLAAEDEQIKNVRAEGKALDVMLSCQLRKG